jgi:hypothetical protein
MFLLENGKWDLHTFVKHRRYRRQIRFAHDELPKEIDTVFKMQDKARMVLNLLGKIVPIPVYRPTNSVDAMERVYELGREAEEAIFSRGIDVDMYRLLLVRGECHELERDKLIPIVLDLLCWSSNVLLSHDVAIKGTVIVEIDAACEHDLFDLDIW